MGDDASPFFIRPHRFDDPDPDDGAFPLLDGHHRILLDEGERILWSGRLNLAGYLVGPAATRELRWRLPSPARAMVTDRRLAFVCTDWTSGGQSPAVRNIHGGPKHRFRSDRVQTRLATGQLRWQWPSRLHLLTPGPTAGPALAAPGPLSGPNPAAATPGPLRGAGPTANLRGAGGSAHRGSGAPTNGGPAPAGRSPGASVNGGPTHARLAGSSGSRPTVGRWAGQPASDDQLLIVCDALRATRQPALALAAAPSQPARELRDLAVLIRRAIAHFRLANPQTVDLAPPERDALWTQAGMAALTDDLADPARGVPMPGALVVEFLDREDYYRWSPRRMAGRRGASPVGGSTTGRPGSAS
nr:hypothetical protein [Micromonospora sp. DSM 115978]